ncbi:uncharacterized protein LOC120356732, partial [Nilaparvata lugens]|uniref:uncharacterized protein LOC120356732 n=1 Tax=Nilaparvata lugens TaxID=108931 RepID=UPI00193EB817
WSLRLDAIIVPPYVLHGGRGADEVRIRPGGGRLYSATWYKDHEEFYRLRSQVITNPAPLQYGRHHCRFVLKNVSLKSLVSIERSFCRSPSFTSVSNEAKMEVI